MLTTDVPLFDSIDGIDERARLNDHENSWRAAQTISRIDNESLKDSIYRLLANHGPKTDDALFELYVKDGGTRTVQRVRTSRKEMTWSVNPRTKETVTPRVRATGENGTSEHGNESQLWAAIV